MTRILVFAYSRCWNVRVDYAVLLAVKCSAVHLPCPAGDGITLGLPEDNIRLCTDAKHARPLEIEMLEPTRKAQNFTIQVGIFLHIS